MKHLLLIFFLIAVLATAGCSNKDQNTGVTPGSTTIVPVPTITTAPPTTVVTTTATPVPTPTPVVPRKITDGYWCRETTMNIGKDPTDIRECYQFFEDGSFKWGYTPGWPMGKSRSCSGSPADKCTYSLSSNGKYEIQGGYFYTLSGDYLIDAHDPPYFIWTETGIP